jgi:gamma-glutamylputrescine oxidase
VGTPSERFQMLNNIPHLTFPGGRYLRSPILALGMLWQRMKDFRG